MKRLLLPVFGVGLVTVALIAAQDEQTCEECNPAECCPEQGQSCCD